MIRTATLLLLVTLGCAEPDAEPPPLVRQAEFGVFFGGQVQERRELPLEVDRTRQIQGFRLQFSRPLSEPLEVEWEIDMPGNARRVRDLKGRRGLGRRTVLGHATVPKGATRFDRELPFVPEDSPGTWNLRVIVGDGVVIDRPVLVFDPAQRRRVRQQERATLDEERTAPLRARASRH